MGLGDRRQERDKQGEAGEWREDADVNKHGGKRSEGKRNEVKRIVERNACI
jgi:hypothetical protein